MSATVTTRNGDGAGVKGLVERGVRMARAVVLGHVVTLKNLLRKPITVNYPYEEYHATPWHRTFPALVVDEETEELKCTACMACVRACPPQIIHIERAQGEDKKTYPGEFYIDMTRCMECNICVEVCPFDALEMVPEFKMAEYHPDDLIFDKERLAVVKRGPKTPWTRRKGSYLEHGWPT